MNALLAALGPALLPILKPAIKQIFDSIVVPAIQSLEAKIPNPDAVSLVEGLSAAVDAEVDKLLS